MGVTTVAERRFDTDTLLGHLLEGDGEAFKSLYERYHGRVYRFIVRQCGNGEQGRKAYYSVWARLLHNSKTSKNHKELKYAFFKNLQKLSLQPLCTVSNVPQRSVIPTGLEEEGSWSTILVDLVRKLPDDSRIRFLFRHEMGLSCNAICRVFGENQLTTQNYLDGAVQTLTRRLSNAGCTKISIDAIYRETRFLKPPTAWDKAVIRAYPEWLEEGVPENLLVDVKSPQTQPKKGFFERTLGYLQTDLTTKISHSPLSVTQRS